MNITWFSKVFLYQVTDACLFSPVIAVCCYLFLFFFDTMKFNETIVFFKVKLRVEAVPMLQQDDLQIPIVLNVLVVIERLLLSHHLQTEINQLIQGLLVAPLVVSASFVP